MSFIVSAFGLTGMAATLTAGAVYGGLTTVGMNLIRGNDPFDNIGQGILMGGITGGIFGGAGGAAGEGAINAGGLDGALGDSASAYSANMGVNSGNAAVNTIANTANPIAGMPSNTFGFDNPLATSQNIPPESYWSQSASGPTVSSDAPSVQAGQVQGTDALADPRKYGLQPPKGGTFGGPQGLSGGPEYTPPPPQTDFLNADPKFSTIRDRAIPSSATSTATTSPKFTKDPFGYLTHKDNRLQVAAGGLGLAGAMGAFNRNAGLNNLPPRSYQRVNTSYNPGTVNPKYGMPGEPYFVGQGYGPETRETFYGAAGGGIRALREGGETAPYVPMTARGQMTIKEDVPDDLDDSAAFKRYLKSDINKKEEKGQAEIDKNVSSWLERYAKADIKGMAEGGPAQQVTQFQPTFSPAQQGIGSLQPYQTPNVPAMESSPTDYNQSPQYAPTQQYGDPATSYSTPAANPMGSGLASYLEGLQYKAPPVQDNVIPLPYVAPPVTPPVTPPVAPPVAPPISEPPSWASNPGTSYNPLVNYDNYGSPLGRKDEPNIPDARPTYNDEGQISNTLDYFQDDEGNVKSIYDEDGIRKYNDDGSRVNEDAPAERREDVLARLQREEPVVNASASPIRYDPDTQTYGETTPTTPTPTTPTLSSPDTQTYSGTTPTPTPYNPATQSYLDNPAFTAPVAPIAKDSGSDSGYFYDDEGGRRSVYDEDGNRRYNDDGSRLSGDGEKAGGPIKSKRYAMGGLAALPEYAAGGRLLSGAGDGMSDSIPAVIKGLRPQRAALADGEFVIPADVVSHLGNGSTKAGGKRLYEMMANIRKARTGNPRQGKQINPMKFIPA